jgi:hypothetical protein
LIAPLTAADRSSLVAAWVKFVARWRRARNRRSRIRGLKIGDIGWITHRQGLLYAEEYGWDVTYEGLVAKILSDFVADFDERWAGAWIAERDGVILGSVFLVKASPTVGQLRLLYVEPRAEASESGEAGAGLHRRVPRARLSEAQAVDQ